MAEQTAPANTNTTKPSLDGFAKIAHFVVIMLENRSFDHSDGRIAGLTGNEFNYDDPSFPKPDQVRRVWVTDRFDMPFDPPHEFPDVQFQLYGPLSGNPGQHNPVIVPAPMNGFIFRTMAAVHNLYPTDAKRVMSYFAPEQIPVLRTLAENFAVFNDWYSSLPGPTWPNRFFVHAATSGGLNYSPSFEQIIAGFSFKGGTIYDQLGDKTSDWHIYHDGMPQTIGISDLRWNFLRQQHDPFDSNFRPMAEFETDIEAGDLAPFTFIEPNYDTGHNYLGGNSMHPLNDIRTGEALIKQVYEALRQSKFWESTMLIITFDEHGGFYDHVPPPSVLSTGDDHRYADTDFPFAFDRLGVRVPALVISAYTEKGTVIGAGDGLEYFDHSSISATVGKKFGFGPLTARAAKARTLDQAINLVSPRSSAEDAPMELPDPAFTTAGQIPEIAAESLTSAARNHAPLSDNQKTFLALALACDLEMTDVTNHPELRSQVQSITSQKQAGDYIDQVLSKVRSDKTD